MTPHAGREAHRSTIDAEPRILPLIAVRPNSVRAIIEPLVGRQSAAHAAVRVSLDGGEGHEIDVDPAAVRDLLEPLVAAAFANAAGPAAETDGPPLHEVDVAVVATADGLEVEIADSGPDQPVAIRVPSHLRDVAARCGAEVTVATCAAGGTAVTVRFPRRGARRQAA
ncbi:MAG: hypothetical protein KJS77_10510 [Planctomycetes bacterium]|nr:hypothetical protein [Planctomycetota bacterium]